MPEARRPDSPFWVEADSVEGDLLRLDAEESHHLLHVFRASPGAPFEAVDGAGHLYVCELAGVERRSALGRIVAREDGAGELPGSLELLVGQPHFGAVEAIVSRTVPLGVSRIAIVPAERGERWRDTGARRERLVRVARAAMKQTRRTRLPRIEFPPGFAAVLPPPVSPERLRFVAEPSGRGWSETRGTGVSSHVTVAIGPPGGLTPAERASLEDLGFAPISLGSNRLRTEDAACAMLALAREGILALARERH
jgi:16S rRNA (uracil1498-N3)-methyltransferase